MTWKRPALFAIIALTLALGSAKSVRANLIVNGGFELYTDPPTKSGPMILASPTGGGLDGSTVTGWTSAFNPTSAYQSGNFVFTPGSGDTTGSYNPAVGYSFFFWGPHNSSMPANNGLPATSPAGGNYLGLDGDSIYNGNLSQTVTGLTPGKSYQLSFYWAGAEEYGFTSTGSLTEQLQVTFGSQTQLTPILTYGSEGFTGWKFQTMTFTADSTSDTLTFLSLGLPSGVPPFALLDGVSLDPVVPEPTTLLLLSAGLFGLGLARRLRARSAAV